MEKNYKKIENIYEKINKGKTLFFKITSETFGNLDTRSFILTHIFIIYLRRSIVVFKYKIYKISGVIDDQFVRISKFQRNFNSGSRKLPIPIPRNKNDRENWPPSTDRGGMMPSFVRRTISKIGNRQPRFTRSLDR